MSLFNDEKFLNNIGHMLRNFRKKQDYLWNFSCPICGDSRKKKIRARGYVYRYRDSLKFKCHNCGETMPLSELIRRLDTTLYKEYIFEAYLEKGQGQPPSGEEDAKKAVFKKKKEYKPAKPTALIGCPSLNTLGPDHPARAYMEWRKLPPKALEELFWTDHFPATVDKFLPEHQYALVDEGRIIIPFYDTNHQLIALQGRSQPRYDTGTGKWVDSPGAVRYITIKADKDAPRIFGMDKLKLEGTIYITEGPFDAMCLYPLTNVIARAGSDQSVPFPVSRCVWIFDNEPRNIQTVKHMLAAHEAGFSVVVWPEDFKYKDINEAIIAGHKQEGIVKIISARTFKGLQFLLEFARWKKCM